MSDIELAPENPFPESLPEKRLPFKNNLTADQRFDAIAEILSLAVLRGKFRKMDYASGLLDLSDD